MLIAAIIGLFATIGGATFGEEPAPVVETVEFERWYSVLLQAQPVGYLHSRIVRRNDRVKTHSQMQVTIGRGDFEVVIAVNESFKETEDGRPVEATLEMNMGGQTIKQRLRFADDHRIHITSQGGRDRAIKLPLSKTDWLTPRAAERYMLEQMQAGAQTIAYRSLSLAAGLDPVGVEHTLVGHEDVEVMGKTVPATHWQTATSLTANITTNDFVDEDGRLLRTKVNFGGLQFDIVASDRDLAQAKVSPPRLLMDTLVALTEPIDQPRTLRKAKYHIALTGPDDGFKLELPTIGHQTVIESDRRSATLKIDLDQHAKAQDDRPTDIHRQPSMMIDSDDQLIRQLVEQALDEMPDAPAADRALALCHFAHDHISQVDLSVGFATVGEVARTEQGDCTEHGVLLAAMLRAAGIPSRTVSGLVYADRFVGRKNLFGYHMWTQAWIVQDGVGRWVDLDATLDPDLPRPFDATHIIISTPALADDNTFNDLLKLAPLLGRLSIERADD